MPKYSDINITGKGYATDSKALLQALLSNIYTQKRERIFLPEYGSDIESFKYKTISDWDAEELRFHIENLIKQDDRMQLTTVIVEPDQDNNLYNVTVELTFNGVTDEVKLQIKSKVV